MNKCSVRIIQGDTGFVVEGGTIAHQETHAVGDLSRAIEVLQRMFKAFVTTEVVVPVDAPLVPGSLNDEAGD